MVIWKYLKQAFKLARQEIKIKQLNWDSKEFKDFLLSLTENIEKDITIELETRTGEHLYFYRQKRELDKIEPNSYKEPPPVWIK